MTATMHQVTAITHKVNISPSTPTPTTPKYEIKRTNDGENKKEPSHIQKQTHDWNLSWYRSIKMVFVTAAVTASRSPYFFMWETKQ